MKNIIRLLFAALIIVGAVIPGKAEMYKYGDKGKGQRAQTAAGCTPSSSFEWLDINNVKTRINAGGDMWWDLPAGTGSKYYIPANGAATSLYAGSLWIAGVDVNQQLKCAALRFRQVGNDYWTGPLTIDGKASITDATCARWDKIFKITRAEVDEFLSHIDADGKLDPSYQIPSIIKNWPAHPTSDDPEGISHYLAPFYDADGNGEYEPEQGDYPYYDIDNELCHTKVPTMEEERPDPVYGETMHGSLLADQVLKGDQTLWWIFNDKGASHTESSGQAIGIEVRAQAFAFATNDEVNNMTFYSYEIINRSTYTLTGTYFSPWTDVDLGYAKDDYVGCDVGRGLGYGYNGSAVDGNGQPEAYGSQPPAVGIDFFQGPYMDPDGLDNPKYNYVYTMVYDPIAGDSIQVATDSTQICDFSINGVNFGNGIVDDERFGMRRFVYHNNSQADNGDPDNAPDYYNYLRGIWMNGNKMQYGGDAFSQSTGIVGPECDFMFPGDSDPWNWGTGGVKPNGGYNENGKYWSEETCKNPPEDRRFMQSAGPFTLEPGAVNYITFGVPWARAASGGAWASVELLRVVDDKCQALFDNCFKVIDGPNAPDLTIRELDQEIIIYLSNSALSNNYKESYIEMDPEIPVSRIETTIWHDTVHAQIGGVDTVLWDPIEQYDHTEIFYDRFYRFEGYKVYQLANAEVGADELSNTDKARLVFQCDVKNNVNRLVNYEFDESVGAATPKVKVEGSDGGISHSFVVTEDKFASGDNPSLVNHKTYYYMAVAYAYNNYAPYSQEPGDVNGLYGQKKPYLEGRKNIQCYTAVPHKTVNGTVLNAVYGDRPAVTRIVGLGNGSIDLELEKDCVDKMLSESLLANSVDIDGNPTFTDNNAAVYFGNPKYPIIYHPSYTANHSPIDVKVIDPLNVVSTDYELWFDSLFTVYSYSVTNDNEVSGDSAARLASHWFLRDLNSGDTLYCDTTTVYSSEKMFIDRGISVNITQPYDIGLVEVGEKYYKDEWHKYSTVIATNNGVITSSIEFENPDEPWLDGIRDTDIPGTSLNWIRAGKYYDKDHAIYNDFNMSSGTTDSGGSKPWDPNENFEKIAKGTWAPYLLCSQSSTQDGVMDPGPIVDANSREGDYFKYTTSVDIVFTADKSKWTRCPVLEMCMDKKLAENGATRFDLRKHASVDKDGNPTDIDWENNPDSCSMNPNDANYIAAQGMGWFPGYVIDVETGMRLNVAFGEDSYLEDLGGRDMLFNPAKLLKSTINQDNGDDSQLYDPVLFRGSNNDPVMGGKHYVYIWRSDSIGMAASAPWKDVKNYGYDGGRLLFKTLNYIQNANANLAKNTRINFYKLAMWVGMPMGIEGMEWLPEGNDCRIRIRIAKPYAAGYGNVPLRENFDELNINGMNPMYKFSIEGMNPELNNTQKTESDLDLITVVPNPYYAYSQYEGNALTNRVKITNLPRKCVISIYSLNGTKIRQFQKDNDDPNIDWDLTNFANTPIASGFYLIHVKDLTSGSERVVKFFGAMRKVDLNTF